LVPAAELPVTGATELVVSLAVVTPFSEPALPVPDWAEPAEPCVST
jgi:hypothetical protein